MASNWIQYNPATDLWEISFNDGASFSQLPLNANILTAGTIPDARFPATLPILSGINLTNVNAAQLNSQAASYYSQGGVANRPTALSSTATGTQNDFDPGIVGDTVIRWSGASDMTLSGFKPAVAPWHGQRVTIYNVSAVKNIILKNASASSTANYRFILYSANDQYIVDANNAGFATFVYDATSLRWMLTAYDQGAWVAFTPTWSSTGTAVVLSNGTNNGWYLRKGKIVYFRMLWQGGSSSTYGTGRYDFLLPTTALTPSASHPVTIGGSAKLRDNSVPTFSIGFVTVGLDYTKFSVEYQAGSARFTSTTPWTWAQSDTIEVHGWYEEA